MGQPRYAKRIDMLQAEGVEAKALYFERDYHSGRKPDCETSCLGKIEHGQYFKRIFTYLAAIKAIRINAKKADVIYCFGLDLTLISIFSTIGLNKKIVMEIGDVRNIQTGDNLLSKTIRYIEKKALNKVKLLIVTAPRFYTEYYQKWLGSNVNHLVIENKLDKAFMPPVLEQEKEQNNKIAIGYFGLLRCQWSAETLFKLAKEHADKFSIVIAGRWMLSDDDLKKLTELDNVVFLGEYKSPDDLSDLYKKIMVVWSCYEPLNESQYNLHWAKTNRFYEALYFKKPLISRKGSSDGDFVLKENIGIAIEKDEKLQFTLEPLTNINNKYITQWSDKLNDIEESCYLYTNEAKNLIQMLRAS